MLFIFLSAQSVRSYTHIAVKSHLLLYAIINKYFRYMAIFFQVQDCNEIITIPMILIAYGIMQIQQELSN
ncbi:hypothetical protein SAMN05444277_1216 [Parafilimonas terrae]|uniref:Uncharacterized protein n=1 Tax=Parafilimonas terrae TaxID=1465490 RepID=A0A1I5ZEH9_9BACT|nr:hypothetical protein SAMN05444277_1216 [Parafilimonas terrae]